MDFNFNSDDKTFYFATRETTLQDPTYRYRYNEPEISVIGKKGNKTTYFENSEYYSSILELPSEYFAKYMAGRLSCSHNFDNEKKCQTFKGDFSQDQIKKFFFEFVQTYKICKSCDYPEAVIEKNEKKNLIKRCNSCGNQSDINYKSIDKSYDFIVKKL